MSEVKWTKEQQQAIQEKGQARSPCSNSPGQAAAYSQHAAEVRR